MTIMLEPLALPEVATWPSVLSPAAETSEVAAEATEPVARHGNVEM